MHPRAQPGYYPGYHTLELASFWDEATRKVVLARVHEVPPIRFFSPGEARVLEAICARLVPQDDRDDEHRIPIVPHIDERLHQGKGDGYRYEQMPPDRDAYRLGIQAIDASAERLHGRPFPDVGSLEQDRLLESLHHGKPLVAHPAWERMPSHRFFLLVLTDTVETYYAHPYAWDEIGYGGPAYPRGYMRLENGEPEPWEVDERRYDWEPSDTSLPIAFEGVGGVFVHHAAPGQGGTH
jgi:hypothetical protein